MTCECCETGNDNQWFPLEIAAAQLGFSVRSLFWKMGPAGPNGAEYQSTKVGRRRLVYLPQAIVSKKGEVIIAKAKHIDSILALAEQLKADAEQLKADNVSLRATMQHIRGMVTNPKEVSFE